MAPPEGSRQGGARRNYLEAAASVLGWWRVCGMNEHSYYQAKIFVLFQIHEKHLLSLFRPLSHRSAVIWKPHCIISIFTQLCMCRSPMSSHFLDFWVWRPSRFLVFFHFSRAPTRVSRDRGPNFKFCLRDVPSLQSCYTQTCSA